MKALRLAAALVAITLAATTGGHADTVQPLERAHAHNDYEHDVPLQDALARGFTSVEADIWLIDGELLVAHDFEELDPARTLRGLYLDPLAARVQAGGGHVFGPDVPFRLLIDIKGASDTAEATWQALEAMLAGYEGLFTTFSSQGVDERAVTAIVSGRRPRATMMVQWQAGAIHAGYDGRLDDLGQLPAEFAPMISSHWRSVSRWMGMGDMPAGDRSLLDAVVATARQDGQIVRFWATYDAPDRARAALWQTLLDADVDLINTDDLDGLRDFLLANDPDEQD